MLILGPLAGPMISAVTWYLPSTAGSLMTLSSSTTSTAGSVRLDPTSPASLSTVRTSSTDAFSCLPPQRTIAYTVNSLSPLCWPAARFAESARHRSKRAAALRTAWPAAEIPLDLCCAPTTKATRRGARSDRRRRRPLVLLIAGQAAALAASVAGGAAFPGTGAAVSAAAAWRVLGAHGWRGPAPAAGGTPGLGRLVVRLPGAAGRRSALRAAARWR